jgi:ribose transport system permease protein
MMFVVQGAALLIMPVPGGEFADAAAMLFVGDAVPGYLPASVIVVLLAMAVWVFLKNTRLGVAMKAIGSDAESAQANGIDIRRVRFLSYTLAGAAYGWAGLAVAANTGSADPLIGAPMLLKIFAAVVLGGIVIGGSAVGAILGALTLTTITTVLLLSGIQTYYVPIVEGAILLFAVLMLSGGRDSPVAVALRRRRQTGAPRLPGSRSPGLFLAPTAPATATDPARARAGWRNHLPLLRLVTPAYGLFVIAVGLTAIVYGSGFALTGFLATLLIFTTFLAILGLGQGAVVILGGLDLSIAWAITLPAVVLTAFANGSDRASIWAIPLVLILGVVIGLINGALIVGFALSPIIVTLAVGGALEGATLVFSNGAPTGYAPPGLAHFVNGRWMGLPSLVWFLLVFAVVATLLLNRSVYGRRLVAVGSSVWAARLSGVHTGRVTIGAYTLSGFCAALVGVLLVGFNSQANYDMGKPYLLASIAAVVLGGTDIRGGRGHYVGIFGGALLFTALSSMLSATSLPEALRSVVYGGVLLAAVLAARQR